MNAYLQEKEAVLEELASTEEGLTKAEAEKRLVQYGPNRLEEAKKDSFFKRLMKQLSDPMIIVLIAAAVVSGITSAYTNESFADVFIILFVVIINALLGMYQESKAEKAIEALKEISAATSKVLRDGEIVSIPSDSLVPGDVIALEAGDAVPADARIIECASLKVEESALTGESVPVKKIVDALTSENNKVPLGDRKNMVYMGSSVAYGRGHAVVTDTGMKTEMGKIANAINETKNSATPLQIKLNQLSKILSIGVLAICVFIFAFSLFRGHDFSGPVIMDTFMLAVSLAVAAIPEGLAAVVTVQLAIGVTRMSKRQAVIRQLTAVETLGCTQIICSDKTGTLTQNRMTVVDHYGDEELLARAMSLCNDAAVGHDGNIQGEPTETALVAYGEKFFHKNEVLKDMPRVFEAPFDSSRKMMSTVHKDGDHFVQYSKGAPDVLLSRCDRYVENGQVHDLDDAKRKEILGKNKEMADQALRVLAAAYRPFETREEVPEDTQELESHLIFVGLCGMIDPIREEVVGAIQECREAGIRPVMITGDHLDTAVAIGKQLGIITDASQAITGMELDGLSDEELNEKIEQYSVYARVQPEHKVRIVDAWQSKGKVVSMSGDGVNDAPSIKRADIGVGMGITGTDVTKNVADMVLADDNFATIVAAVGEGRRIYDNIRKAIQFLLSSNVSEVLSIFGATVLGFTILKPVHILWINLLTDTFPALALGMEDAEKDVMKRDPRPKKEGIFAGGLAFDVIFQGIVITVITLTAYFVGHYIEAGVWEIADSADGMTMAFLTLSMTEIFHSFNMRSRTQSIFTIKNQNKYLWLSLLGSFAITICVIYIPFLSDLFEFEHISVFEFAVSILMAVCIIPIVEIEKLIVRLVKKNRK